MEDKVSVYVVIVAGGDSRGFDELSDVSIDSPEEVARDVSYDEAVQRVKDLVTMAATA